MSSGKKTLIGNWVEERQCASLEADSWNDDGTLCTRLHRQGHKGILTMDLSSDMASSTTVKSSYQLPASCPVRETGKRQDLLEKQLYLLASQEEEEERRNNAPTIKYSSVTKDDFSKEFTAKEQPPTRDHNIYSEQPLTYWKQNLDNVTGVSQVTTVTSPFHRNAAFSTPIEEYLDQPKPHEFS